MKRTPEEKQLLATWWVLQELNYYFLSNPGGETAEITLKEPKEINEPDNEIKHAILKQLGEQDIIQLLDWRNSSYSVIKNPTFETAYKLYESLVKDIDTPESEPVKFDDDEASLMIGRKRAQLPPYKLEHTLCQVMFEYLPNETVDSGVVIEKMGQDVNEKSTRQLKDTVMRINKRVSDVLGIPGIYKQGHGTIRRLR